MDSRWQGATAVDPAMILYSRPSIVCRCGRVFFDGDIVWPHVRTEYEKARTQEKAQRMIVPSLSDDERRRILATDWDAPDA